MLMIRFQRTGRTNDPAFRIAVLEKARAAKSGSVVELLGTYNPKSKALTLKEDRVKHWLSKGAEPTDSIKNLLIGKGVIEGKKVNVLPKKSPIVKDVPAQAAAPVAEAPAVPEVAAPSEAEVVAEVEDTETEAPEPAPAEEASAPVAEGEAVAA